MKNFLNKKVNYINSALKEFLPKDNSIISKGMRYSVLAGGKRLRPIFLILSAELFGGKSHDVLPAACAIEYIHTYSLIHDDLPAMDNDDWRRGIPTNHKKFGEAVAILCGDALLTESFSLILKSKSSPKNINEAIRILSNYAGYRGMIMGQVKDTLLIKDLYNNSTKMFLKRKLKLIQIQKTSALIIASLRMGAILAGADKNSLQILETYGTDIGIAFQITDDILDVYGNENFFNEKSNDLKNKKLTALSLYGKKNATKKAYEYIEKAKKAISVFGSKSKIFIRIAEHIIDMTH
ncbi:MAG: polyprenyl synthetase family protein [Endomicrobium sp.]|nr:polyprenyl synthetase family protein [Endomicrobium sp.]